MKKYRKIIIPICLVLVVLLIISLRGVSLSTSKFIFSTRYYKTPLAAFEADNDLIMIKEDVDVYVINENNCFYIAMTENNELLVSKMFCKNERFFSTGNYVIYSLADNIPLLNDSYNEDIIFSEKGLKQKHIYWRLIITENEEVANNSTLIYDYILNDIKYYIYFIVK